MSHADPAGALAFSAVFVFSCVARNLKLRVEDFGGSSLGGLRMNNKAVGSVALCCHLRLWN